MAILYSLDLMPHVIPESEVKSFLGRGYRRALPVATPALVEPEIVPPPHAEPVNPQALNVNTCSLKELAALPGASMSIAQSLKSKRPFAVVEDLIAIQPAIDWLTLADKLTF